MKRSLLAALTLAAFLLGPALAVCAQTGHLVSKSVGPPLRHLAAPRASATADGSRITLAADAALDGYQSYQDGDTFYVLIPRAELLRPAGALNGRGYSDAQVLTRQSDLLLSFRTQAGVRAHASQQFNRLDIVFTAQPATVGGDAPVAAQDVARTPAGAQPDDHAVLQQLLKRIAELEGQVAQLKNAAVGDASNPAASEPPPVPDAAGEEASEQAQAQAILDQHGHETMPGPRLQIQGFADVNYRAGSQRDATNAFSLGQLDLFITSKLSEKFSVLSELIIEANRDNTFDFEIHRLLLRYAPSEFFNLSAGRYHTAIGYYNTAYHHGSWFATAANRPFLFAFEGQGGPLPLHNVGLSATGRIPSGSLGLRYVAEIGNGRATRSPTAETVQSAGDENNGKSYNFALLARPDAVPGLQTGFSFYHDHLTPLTGPNVSQMILAGHIVYRNPRYEWLNEAIFVRHKPDGARAPRYTPGFYTQFARRFGQTTPYFRYQYVNAPDNDTIFTSVGRRNGPSVGVRYDVTEYAALKAQYDRTQRRRQAPLDELILQLAFTF